MGDTILGEIIEAVIPLGSIQGSLRVREKRVPGRVLIYGSKDFLNFDYKLYLFTF